MLSQRRPVNKENLVAKQPMFHEAVCHSLQQVKYWQNVSVVFRLPKASLMPTVNIQVGNRPASVHRTKTTVTNSVELHDPVRQRDEPSEGLGTWEDDGGMG